MANHKSAMKRARQNVKRRLRNRMLRAAYRTEIKKFIDLIEENKIEEAEKSLPRLYKVIDKSRTKGIIHKNVAARNKSKMATKLNKALAAV